MEPKMAGEVFVVCYRIRHELGQNLRCDELQRLNRHKQHWEAVKGGREKLRELFSAAEKARLTPYHLGTDEYHRYFAIPEDPHTDSCELVEPASYRGPGGGPSCDPFSGGMT